MDHSIDIGVKKVLVVIGAFKLKIFIPSRNVTGRTLKKSGT
jgi:hypothetical protein